MSNLVPPHGGKGLPSRRHLGRELIYGHRPQGKRILSDDAAAHKQTSHYLEWRETVADWMAEPRQGISYNGLYPVID